MKKAVLILCIAVCTISAFAQSSKVVCKNCDIYVEGAVRGKILKMPKPDIRYVLHAAEEGFVTQRIDPVESFIKGQTLDIVLEEISPYDLEQKSKVITFGGYIDRTAKLSGATGVAPYVGYYTHPNVGTDEFREQFTQKLDKYGYNVNLVLDRAFSSKEKNPELVIAGDILNFHKETRGTAGFKITLEVRWTVFDVVRDEVVFEWTNVGYSDRGERNKIEEDLKVCLDDATISLLHNEEFKLLSMTSEVRREAGVAQELVKPETKTFENNISMVESSTKSALTIVTSFGHGSGFIISEEGYALTSQHVVSGSEECQVVFNNGFKLNAKVIAFDTKSDVALLKIDGSGFDALPLMSEGKVKAGEEVITIGTPASLKLGQTVTKGVVSGEREIEEMHYVQTDVSISPGNSGGALINSKGEVIAIITAKIVDEDIEGLGFAISIADAVKALNIVFE
jgi:S1-C subfamily serine protease